MAARNREVEPLAKALDTLLASYKQRPAIDERELAERLNLMSGILDLARPFPGKLGRPSTYQEIVSTLTNVRAVKTVKATETSKGNGVVDRVTPGRRGIGGVTGGFVINMKSASAMQPKVAIVTKPIEKLPEWHPRRKKAEKEEAEAIAAGRITPKMAARVEKVTNAMTEREEEEQESDGDYEESEELEEEDGDEMMVLPGSEDEADAESTKFIVTTTKATSSTVPKPSTESTAKIPIAKPATVAKPTTAAKSTASIAKSTTAANPLFTPSTIVASSSNAKPVAKPTAKTTRATMKIVPKKKDIIDKYKEELDTHQKHNTDGNQNDLDAVELEIRFHDITPSQFQQALSKIREQYKPVYSETVNRYHKDIREVAVMRGGLRDVKYVRKRTVDTYTDAPYYVALAIESEYTESTEELLFTISRQIKRWRATINNQYYLDLTEVEVTNERGTSTKYEIELELISGSRIPTLEEFINVVRGFDFYQHDIMAEVAKLVGRNAHTVQQLLTKVTPIDRHEYYGKLYKDGYYLTDKLNGTRHVVYIHASKVYVIGPPDVLISTTDTDITGDYVLDCEMYNGDLYVIDVVYPSINSTIEERVLKAPSQYKKKSYIYIDKPSANHHGIEIAARHFYTDEIAAGQDLDGLILSDASSTYYTTSSYKWKPAELETIDLSLKLASPKAKGGFYDYILYSEIQSDLATYLGLTVLPTLRDKGERTRIQFCPALDPVVYRYSSKRGDLEGKVFEMRYDLADAEWILMRERTDKQHPNDFAVCESIFCSYYNPFTLEMLWSAPEAGYYPYETKPKDYEVYNSAMRYMFGREFDLRRGETVLDAGPGKGQDIPLYNKREVAKVLGMEPDTDAITSLVKRRYPRDRRVIDTTKGGKDKKGANVMAFVHGLGEYDAELADEIFEVYGIRVFDRVIANLSAHYFMNTEERMDASLRQIAQLMKSKSKFIFTALDETQVKNEILIGTVRDPRFRIVPKGDGKVDVRMPFSGEMKEETLVRLDWLQKYAEKNGFSVRKSALRPDHQDLSEDDARYAMLHCAYIFTKQ